MIYDFCNLNMYIKLFFITQKIYYDINDPSLKTFENLIEKL